VDLGLNGQRALVGGGSAGLGGGIATVLAAEGARVAIVGRTKERLDAAAAATGVIPIVADLGQAEGPLFAVTSAVDRLGGLDLLVVNSVDRPRARSSSSTRRHGHGPSKARSSPQSASSARRSRTYVRGGTRPSSSCSRRRPGSPYPA
jgi:NAD(P)-dependent dehydrogenase (short-subunit alcohol dehydrogenase family)